ncbi:MAG: DUF262 domain-containing protein [Candidatus Paceibacterota bacterium]
MRVTRATFTVSDFLSWQRNGNLVLNPGFQRRKVWSPGAKSYLIDTIVRGLPIPIIFLRPRTSTSNPTITLRDVVDGQQRIRTVLTYIDPFVLDDYKPEKDAFLVMPAHNEAIAGKAFNQLPISVQSQILDYEFSVDVLPSGVDDRQISQIFARMNATGVKLNPQELRNAKYYGFFKTCMYQLASEQLPNWRSWHVFTENNLSRMDEVELTSEFAYMMLNGIKGKTPVALDRLYKDKEEEFVEQGEVERRFRHIMTSLEDSLGDQISLTAFKKKTLFYSLFVASYILMFGHNMPTAHVKANPLRSNFRDVIMQIASELDSKTAPIDVIDATSKRVTHASSRKTITNYILSRLT